MWVIEMNNQVVFAAAGHGKTYSLCSQAKTAIDNTNKHVLLHFSDKSIPAYKFSKPDSDI